MVPKIMHDVKRNSKNSKRIGARRGGLPPQDRGRWSGRRLRCI